MLREFYIPVSKPEMQFRMFWAHSRSVSLASRDTGVPAMFRDLKIRERGARTATGVDEED